jgi:hypothetical protein
MPSVFRIGSALALVLVLAGCTKGGQFDPTEIFSSDVFDSKKKLKGEREPVFPNGVPGTTTGVPADLVKGYQPPPDSDVSATPAPVAEAAPKPKPKPKPTPKIAAAPAPTSAPPRINIGAKPGTPVQQGGPAATDWPAPPSTAAQGQQPAWPTPPSTASQQSVQSRWPDPPAPAKSTQ